MPNAVIANPILNSPYDEPRRHFRFTDAGISDEVVDLRRVSAYFVPIAQPKVRGKQLTYETQWTKDRLKPNDFINRVRDRVDLWRRGGYVDVTRTTRLLLDYWTRPERERRLFFCQVEALETAIYLAEVAPRHDAWIVEALRGAGAPYQTDLYRVALKMATGTGKTVVMAMLIAWQALNKRANPQDARFADAFLVVAPGITIRDRLRVLLPSDPGNYYRAQDIAPPALAAELGAAKIIVTNFHAFKPRERGDASRLTRQILTRGREEASPFRETPDQMVRRVCRELGTKRNVVVLNDEAHHCYRRRQAAEAERLTGDDLEEAKVREEEARIWISGLEAVKRKMGVRVVYDLSATPFFLKGSGEIEGTLFPWVVSDFSLIDAIESGLVKVPRVPIEDDAAPEPMPTYRDIWARIRDQLPKGRRKDARASEGPQLPVVLEGALRTLYDNYVKYYRRWEANAEARAAGLTPPVFIVVCSNTSVSKLVFDFVAGWEKPTEDGATRLVPGELDLFSNVEAERWTSRPRTILVDSRQLESGEAMSKEFKAIAGREIDEFKSEVRLRFPGRDTEKLTDEDLLREVMNTVGKAGKLGEGVRCVVSVSMLTEGWDANTVTHILGVRAFSTQLLCEQVVGRALRRMSYVPNEEGRFDPEYAEVYGVPFSFIPTSGSAVDPKPPKPVTRVRALGERADREITFPRIDGYRYELPAERIEARFDARSRLALSSREVPTTVEVAPIVGLADIHTLDALRARREQEVAFRLSKVVLARYFGNEDGESRPWLFPQMLAIVRRWMDECVDLKDNAFPQLLLLNERAHDAADRIYQAIVTSTPGQKRLVAIPQAHEPIGSTRAVDFDTTKPVRETRADRCHVSHVVADSGWEIRAAQVLEGMPEVHSYVKNQGLGLSMRYTEGGREHTYIPDFLVRLDDGHGPDDLLTLVVEVSGQDLPAKRAKTNVADALWVPAVNNHGGFGRWAFVEVTDVWDTERAIRDGVTKAPGTGLSGGAGSPS